MRELIAALLLGVIIAVPAPADAQAEDTPPETWAAQASPEDKTRAKEAFVGARTAYKKTRYKDALEGFQAAYASDPRPEMLYNIGLCQHKLGQLVAARDTYHKFLEEKPETKARPKVEQKIAEIDAALKKPPRRAEPSRAAAAPVVYNRTGLQLLADIGIGAFTSDVVDKNDTIYFEFTPSIGVGLGVQHRPIPWLSYGARITWSAIAVNAPQVSTITSRGWYFEGAALAEFYPLAIFSSTSRFDPFIGIGVGFGQAQVDLDGYSWNIQGPTLHVSTGVQIFVNRWIGVGAVLSYMHGFWLTSCDNDGCGDVAGLAENHINSLPGMLFLGAEGAFHLL